MSFVQTLCLFILGVLFSFTSSCWYMLIQFVTTGNWLLSWNNRAKRPEKTLKVATLLWFFQNRMNNQAASLMNSLGILGLKWLSTFQKGLRIPNYPKQFTAWWPPIGTPWSDITGPSGISYSCSRRTASAQDPGATLELTRCACLYWLYCSWLSICNIMFADAQ